MRHLIIDGAQKRTFQNQIMPNQRDKKLKYLIFLPNNDLVMTKFGPRFELFGHIDWRWVSGLWVENIVRSMENTNVSGVCTSLKKPKP